MGRTVSSVCGRARRAWHGCPDRAEPTRFPGDPQAGPGRRPEWAQPSPDPRAWPRAV